MVQRIHDNGHVYEGTYEGWYCPRCADFKTESEIEDGNRCPIHKIVLDREKEDNWFFRLSAFQEPLEQLYAERPDFVIPRNRYNEALSFIKQGLHGPVAVAAPAQVGRPGALGPGRRSSTSGSTRCSTTTRRSPTRARARTSRTASGRPTST